MKKILLTILLACFSNVHAQDMVVNINGFNATIDNPLILKNIQHIASCSPKKYAQEDDYAKVVFYSEIKRPDLMADFLANKCVTLNNNVLKNSRKNKDQAMDLLNPIKYANSQEALLYMFVAQAPLDKVENENLDVYLASNPTYFTQKEATNQKMYAEEGIAFLKNKIGASVRDQKIDLNALFMGTEQDEENYDKMLATLIGWIHSKNSEKINNDTLFNKLAYFGRNRALSSLLSVDALGVRFNEFNETPSMVSFKPYCGITEPWQKEKIFKTQILLLNNMYFSDYYQKNISGQTFSDYVISYITKNNDKQKNTIIFNKVQRQLPDLLTKKPRPITTKDVSGYCN